MGNYAASSGYYIACNAHKIFAENNDNGPLAYWNTLTLANFTNRIDHVEQVIPMKMQSGYSPFVPLMQNIKKDFEGVENIYKLCKPCC
jgi:protease-4